jgi:hypothetical protein
MADNTISPSGEQDSAMATTTAPSNLSDAILEAAQASVKGDVFADDKLLEQITGCLERGDEEAIAQARENAIDMEVADAIKLTTRMAAVQAYNATRPGTTETLKVELFVIPIMMVLPAGKFQEVPRAITLEETRWLVQSFEAQGLKHPEQELMLIAPQLWNALEIYHLPYGKVHELTQAFGEAITNQSPIDVEKILGTNVSQQSPAPGKTLFSLRYLIGAFAHRVLDELSFDKKENDEMLDAWRKVAEEHLEQQFGCSCEVFYPTTLYRGLESGWFYYHAFRIAMEQALTFRKARVLPGEIIAVISLHTSESAATQVRIGYSRYTGAGTPELIGGSVWPLAPFDKPGDIAEFFKEALERDGLRAVEIVAAPQIDDSSDEEGSTTFLPPSSPAAPGGIAPLPASKHMH